MLDFVRWLVQGRVILVQFSGVLSLQDVHEMNAKAAVLMQQALPPHVHVIADGTRVTEFDKDLISIRTMHGALAKHPLVNWHIIVDPKPNPAMKFIGSTVFNLLGARMRVMTSIDEAMAFLQAGESEPLIRLKLDE